MCRSPFVLRVVIVEFNWTIRDQCACIIRNRLVYLILTLTLGNLLTIVVIIKFYIIFPIGIMYLTCNEHKFKRTIFKECKQVVCKDSRYTETNR